MPLQSHKKISSVKCIQNFLQEKKVSILIETVDFY